MIRFRESFETGDTTRWAAAGTAQFTNGGRGSGHIGSLGYSGSFTNYASVNVPAAITYGQGMAVVTPSSGAALELFQFREQAGTKHISILYNAAGKIEVRKGSGAGTLIATSLAVWRTDGSYRHHEAKVTVHSSTGSVGVKVDEQTVAFDNPVTGINTDNGGAHTIDQLVGGDCDVSGVRSGWSADDWVVSDTTGAVNNDYLVDVRVLYGAANAAGTFTDGTASSGTQLSCVSTSDGDTTYVSQDATGLPHNLSMNIENAPSNLLSILEVAPIAIVRKDDAGADTGRMFLKSGATTDDGGADVAVLSTYFAVQRGYEQDPNTSAAWTGTNFNAIEVGWRRVA